jgi:hypothetical protein
MVYCYLLTICIPGFVLSSVFGEFAQAIEDRRNTGNGHLTFTPFSRRNQANAHLKLSELGGKRWV